ncbi:GNAT family N-acetyltransferase [Rheinheimera sp. WS51]|uniref:GNAT family N-acetyltransferase n=1 Tax=Rheinheimera sp. WS51 TaxID=3425886 RepID=UPI003D91496C
MKIRLPIIWQGQRQLLLNATLTWLGHNQFQRLYWLGEDAPEAATLITAGNNYQHLGTECDVLVVNAFSGFPADAVAAISGCVKAGGLWLVLCPEFRLWQQQANPAHSSLLPYPIDATEYQGLFIRFWLQQITTANLFVFHGQQLIQQLAWPTLAASNASEPPFASKDQAKAAQAICRVVTGHRRRPLVLTADRGRGKSAILGITAAQLVTNIKQPIIITAPSPQAAAIAVNHFKQLAAESDHDCLQFMPLDELLLKKPAAALLMIDEAAAIPTPILQQLVAHYSRIVFATTEHGYEGTGRGFTVRFQQHLNKHCPGWQKLHLQQPIRYQIKDPLEQLIFSSFLLQSHPVNFDQQIVPGYVVKTYTAADWLQQINKLQQVFSLLSLAHYQTQVKDLASLLDNPDLMVMTFEATDTVLACALLSAEGNLPPQLAKQIYYGQRRIQGHLLAQSLAFHCAKPELATRNLLRVMRIAVQPELQRQKLGQRLLQQIEIFATQHNIDYLGTSYGANINLLQFWQQAGYTAVRLGQTADKASGEYSLLMLKPLIQEDVSNTLTTEFAQYLPNQAAVHYPLLATQLLLALARPQQTSPITPQQLEQLQLFCQQKRPYELVNHLLLAWFNQQQNLLPAQLKQTLAAKLWQQQSWQQLSANYDFSGKKAIINYWQNTLVNLIKT